MTKKKNRNISLSKGTAKISRAVAITSKSYVHRLIIASALCEEDVEIVTNIMSKDMEATVKACETLSRVKSGAVVDCGESGSTARFILPLAAICADSATITGSGRLPERPMGPLCDVLTAAGVSVSSDHLPIKVSGKPYPGCYEIPGNVSSQFITGLLFILPQLSGESHLVIKGKLESAPYVDMTIDVLEKFGIRIDKCADGFIIPGRQKYRYPVKKASIIAEGDWSNAAYVMTLASLASGRAFDSFTVCGLNPNSIQGDRAVIDIFKKFGIGVTVKLQKDGSAEYTIKGNPSKPVDIDCSQIPDLVPALAVLAAYTKGDSVFRNVERLRMKECDRIDAVSEMLRASGVVVDITSFAGSGREDMTVHGKGMGRKSSSEIIIDSRNDHRIAMAAAAIAFAEDVPVTIEDAYAVDKSYPGFYELAENMGLNICHLN